MAYKGSSLAGDQIMVPGDYLMSPNGRFAALLLVNGSLAVFWTRLVSPQSSSLPSFDPEEGGLLWGSPAGLPTGNYFLCMQTDGNLVAYNGTNFQNSGGALWATNTNVSASVGSFALNLENDGCLTVRWSIPLPFGLSLRWNSGTSVKGEGEKRLLSGVDSSVQFKRRMSLTAPHPPSTQITMDDTPAKILDEQIWVQWDWYQAGSLVGSVFLNKNTKMALSYNGNVKPVDQSYFVNADSIWTRGGAENHSGDYPPLLTAVRPLADVTQNLNVRGDSYPSGVSVQTCGWDRASSNLIWEITTAKDSK
jgi:hypothetical protein